MSALSLFVGLYVVARYGRGVLNFFFLDDFWLLHIVAANAKQGGGPWAMFAPDQAGFILYRPLTQQAYFAALWMLFRLDATGYHVVQILTHAANAVLALAIARRLTNSWARATAVSLLYAAAPGHAVAVYWVAAFTMAGTALAVFAAMLWWLLTGGRVRAAGCAILQVVALLCSEHAVVLPVLLVLIGLLGTERVSLRRMLRQVAPAGAIDAAYLAAKLWYFRTVAAPSGAYAMDANGFDWLHNLGQYAAASLNLFSLAGFGSGHPTAFGAAIAVAAVSAVAGALAGIARWRLTALGLAVFVLSLAPVLPLSEHYFDYFVGVAAFGPALALVGLCDAIHPHWGAGLAVGLAVAVLGVDLLTCDRAALDNASLKAVLTGQQTSAQLLMDLYTASQRFGPDAELGIGQSPATSYVLDVGHAHEVFFDPALHVSVSGGRTHSPTATGRTLPVLRADPRLRPFWWDPQLDWARALFPWIHRWYTGWSRGCGGSEPQW